MSLAQLNSIFFSNFIRMF